MRLSTLISTLPLPTATIYALTLKTAPEIPFYIGSTTRPLHERLQGHLTSPSENVNTYITKYGAPNILIIPLVKVPETERFKAEQQIINLARKQDIPLANKGNPHKEKTE